jgi:phospholipid/cholesterol/gamma-HCH transport system ATP-binding protein
MIEIIDLKKSFGDKPVLRGVNLKIETGESVVIIGRSGCGKSVLLKLLIGLLTPDSGQILIDGEDITRMSGADLYRVRRKFGVLFQGSALFDSMTVEENIALGLREHTNISEDEISRIVDEKLSLVGLPDVENLKPAELSGGMKKRVGLARAIAMNPQYVLYDEPTTGLDPIMADNINELVVHHRSDPRHGLRLQGRRPHRHAAPGHYPLRWHSRAGQKYRRPRRAPIRARSGRRPHQAGAHRGDQPEGGSVGLAGQIEIMISNLSAGLMFPAFFAQIISEKSPPPKLLRNYPRINLCPHSSIGDIDDHLPRC